MTNQIIKLKEAIFAYGQVQATHVDNFVDVWNRGGEFLPRHYNRPPQNCLDASKLTTRIKLITYFCRFFPTEVNHTSTDYSFYLVDKIMPEIVKWENAFESRNLNKTEWSKFKSLILCLK